METSVEKTLVYEKANGLPAYFVNNSLCIHALVGAGWGVLTGHPRDCQEGLAQDLAEIFG
jgi:hypothetical protein